MSRLLSAIEQIRRQPLKGTTGLLRSNLCHQSRCFRLQLDLKKWDVMKAAVPQAGREVSCEAGTLERLDHLRSDPKNGVLPSDFFEDRAHGLRRFYLGFADGRLAHITWLAGPGEPTTVSRWTPGPGGLEFRNVCTLSHMRRKGVFARVARRILEELVREGCQYAYSHVDIHNTPSLRAFEALGFVREKRIATLRVLGFDLHQDCPVPPSPPTAVPTNS